MNQVFLLAKVTLAMMDCKNFLIVQPIYKNFKIPASLTGKVV